MKEHLYRFDKPCTFKQVMPLTVELQNMLNKTEWRGREPGTCKVLHVTMGRVSGDNVGLAHITVRYRPHGWQLRLADKTNDGEFLDGNGNPLPEGQEPVILEFNIDHSVEFNDYDFGTLVSEPEE